MHLEDTLVMYGVHNAETFRETYSACITQQTTYV